MPWVLDFALLGKKRIWNTGPMADNTSSHSAPNSRSLERTFERKVWRAKLALIFEQIWRRVWLVLAIVGLFTLVSLLGLWDQLPALAHKIVLGMFAVAIGLALLSVFIIRLPTRSDAIRRIEQISNIPHRPASSYEDTMTGASADPETQALWTAHRKRLAALFDRLRVGKPRPRADRYDPFALRALLMLLIAAGLGFVGFQSLDRIKTAFQFADSINLASVRLDAWVSPPTYTTRPPVMLSDGAIPVAQSEDAKQEPAVLKPVVVPSGSTLVVRVTGLGAQRAEVATYSSESFEDESKAHSIAPEKSVTGGDVQEFRSKVGEETMVRVTTKSGQLAKWYISVIPDKLPTIKLTAKPVRTPRGSMKLAYEVLDDYGLTGAVAHFEDAESGTVPAANSNGVGRPVVTPPRKRKPLEMKLRLPGAKNKDGLAQTYLDFAPTPWAGRRAIMTLRAKDVAGQTGVSPGIEIVLPERKFTKPLARAVIEQRRKLFDDPNVRRREVTLALNALTTEPEDFFEDLRVYLSLRSVFHRLQRSGAPDQIKQSIDQLWHTALRIEEGDLSDAERRVREAQDKLAKALEEGASEEEIKKLMQELRQAMNDFMDQMAKQNQEQQRDFTQGNDPNNQSVNQNDINEMMRNIEELAKNGAREQAPKMLSQMRDMMERMQRGGQQNAQQARQQQQTMKALRKLGGMVGDQQQLMDDTHTQQHRGQGNMPGQRQGQQQAPGQVGPGQRGQPRSGQSNQRGMGLGQQQNQYGRGMQRGQRGQGGQGGQSGQQNPQASAQELAERQRQLREQLSELQRRLSEQGIGQPQQLENARQAMQNAEQALRNQNLSRAMEEQARALSNMQQGARSMAQDMMSNSPQRFGKNGQDRRDPLGRPQRSSGPELGTSVKVPEEIELQRAREIIDELRRRRGEVTRPMLELDYLDRLLRRF